VTLAESFCYRLGGLRMTRAPVWRLGRTVSIQPKTTGAKRAKWTRGAYSVTSIRWTPETMAKCRAWAGYRKRKAKRGAE
jgi:hypothetical protein